MATSTRHGQLHEFDVVNETVTTYLERIELYFDANDVSDEKRCPSYSVILEPRLTGYCEA